MPLFATVGLAELALIALILLLFLGANRLPRLGRALGETWRLFRHAVHREGEE